MIKPQVVLVVKNLPADAGDTRDVRSTPGSGRAPWRSKWQLFPVFLPGESHGRRSLVGYGPRGRKESDTTERLHFHLDVPQVLAGALTDLQEITSSFHELYSFWDPKVLNIW